VLQAEQMIAEQTAHFLRWLKGRSVVPTIAALNQHYDRLRQADIERAKRLLQNGTSPAQALDALARGSTSKLLHAPLAALNSAGDAERVELVASLQRVYKLPQTGEP
jgi:glutamyl-tRNA reductase